MTQLISDEVWNETWKARMQTIHESNNKKRKTIRERGIERRERFLQQLTPEQREIYLARQEYQKHFNETYKTLHSKVKSVTVTFSNGIAEVLELKDKKYGIWIDWAVKDFLLKKVIIPQKIHIDEYGNPTR